MKLNMKISNKIQMVSLLTRGDLGNSTRIWRKKEDLYSSGFTGLVAIRYLRPGNHFQEGIYTSEIPARIGQLKILGLSENLMYFHEWTPPESLVLLCHLVRSERYCDITYTENKNIRIDARDESGISAVSTIKSICGNENYEKLVEINSKYPDSVIEFSYHNKAVANNSDMIIWEVRNY